jgi:hypothetical protein
MQVAYVTPYYNGACDGRYGRFHDWVHAVRDANDPPFDADVYVNLYDRELVVEVAMGDNPREIEHIEKHLDKDFIIYVAARNQEILEGLTQRMQEKGLETDRVDFRTVREFNDLEELPE